MLMRTKLLYKIVYFNISQESLSTQEKNNKFMMICGRWNNFMEILLIAVVYYFHHVFNLQFLLSLEMKTFLFSKSDVNFWYSWGFRPSNDTDDKYSLRFNTYRPSLRILRV